MILNVYDSALNVQGIIDVFESLLWVQSFQEVGTFQLVCADTAENRNLLKVNYVIRRTNENNGMLITTVTRKNGKITATGYDLKYVLQIRVVRNSIFENSLFYTLKQYLENVDTGFIFDENTENIDTAIPDVTLSDFNANLYSLYLKSINDTEIAVYPYIDFKNKKYRIKMVQAKIKTENGVPLKLTEKNDDLLNITHINDSVGTATYIFCQCEDIPDDVETPDGVPTLIYEKVAPANIFERHELKIKTQPIIKTAQKITENGTVTYKYVDYQATMNEMTLQAAANYRTTSKAIKADINLQSRHCYIIGEKVYVNENGIKIITETEEQWDSAGYQYKITVGDRQRTIVDKINEV